MARVHLIVAAALATAFVLVSARPTWAGCEKDTDCKGDRVCNAGACVAPPQAAAACQKDSDCPGDSVCETNVCVSPTSVAPAPGAPPTTTTTPAPAAAVPAPVATTPPPASGPPPAGPPATSPGPGAPATPPADGPPAKVDDMQQHRYVSLLVPNVDGLWGLAGDVDFNKPNQPLTLGVRLGGVGNFAGEGEASFFNNFYAVTVGARSLGKTFAFAGRVGAQLNITQVEFMGMKDTSLHFEGVALADISFGHFFVGAEYWFRAELSALRIGGTW